MGENVYPNVEDSSLYAWLMDSLRTWITRPIRSAKTNQCPVLLLPMDLYIKLCTNV